MSYSSLPLMLLMALFVLPAARSSDLPLPTVGYLVFPSDYDQEDDVDAADNIVFCIRGGEKLDAFEGMELQAGDEIETGEESAMALVFLDHSTVTLRPSSRIVINDYFYPEKKLPTHLTLTVGKAFFSVNPRPEDARFFIKSQAGEVEVKGTKFEVFTQFTGGRFITQVAVTKGSVSLRPKGQGSVDIVSGTQTLLTIANTNIPGFTGSPIDIQTGNLSKDQIKQLEANSLSDVELSLGKKRDIKIKSSVKRSDGSITSTKLTEIDGTRTSLKSSTVNTNKKVVSKIQEKGDKRSIYKNDGVAQTSIKLKGTTGSIRVKFANTFSSASPLMQQLSTLLKAKGPPTISFKGTVTVAADGTITGIATAKDGATINYTEKKQADGSVIKTQQYSLKQTDGKTVLVFLIEENLVDGTTLESKTLFPAGATQGTKETFKTFPDGSTQTITQTVLLNFTPVGPPVLGPINPPASPKSPLISTKSTILDSGKNTSP